jgi:plastocyanin
MRGARLGRVPTILLALLVPAVALVTVVVTLDATSDDTGAVATGAGKGAGGTAITIKNFQYSPDPIVVTAGDTITVTNDDGTAHTLTADHGTFDTGNLGDGAETTITVAAPGTYAYHCDIHNYMTGKIEAR